VDRHHGGRVDEEVANGDGKSRHQADDFREKGTDEQKRSNHGSSSSRSGSYEGPSSADAPAMNTPAKSKWIPIREETAASNLQESSERVREEKPQQSPPRLLDDDIAMPPVRLLNSPRPGAIVANFITGGSKLTKP
jgi:hypothetical protein